MSCGSGMRLRTRTTSLRICLMLELHDDSEDTEIEKW